MKNDINNFLPTKEDLIHFEEKGWYQSPKIFSDEEIKKALEGVDEFYKGIVDFPLNNFEGLANDSSNENPVIRNNEFVTLQKSVFRTLGWHKTLVEISKVLMNTDKVRLFADSLVTKYPSVTKKKGIVGWHSDKAYWPTCTSNKLLTVWIPLQDVTFDMGPLLHIDGSHKWNQEELKQFFSFNSQDLDSLKEYLNSKNIEFKMSPMTLKKGCVSIHSCHTVHSSSPNVSDNTRSVLAVHLQDGDNHYQEAFKPNGDKIVIGYDKLCGKDENGNPNYSDSKLFPKLN
jgi:ectoine hydroxylase-related dioxygenase (phytanoyl-CoA dioxygenase family)